MAAAKADILIIGSQHHLGSLLDHTAVLVKPGVEGGFFAAPADGFYLLQLIRQDQELVAAGEKLPLKVGLQPVADNGDIAVVHQVDQVVDLLLGEKLGLVHNDAGEFLQVGVGHLLHLVEVDAGMLQADAGADHVVPVPGVQLGLHQEGVLTTLLIIKPGHEGVGGFAGAHGSEFEVKLCHLLYSPSHFCRMRLAFSKAEGIAFCRRCSSEYHDRSPSPETRTA